MCDGGISFQLLEVVKFKRKNMRAVEGRKVVGGPISAQERGFERESGCSKPDDKLQGALGLETLRRAEQQNVRDGFGDGVYKNRLAYRTDWFKALYDKEFRQITALPS
jgi:hypothetical protein